MDKMSQNQTPFVVATTDPYHPGNSPVVGRSPVHSPTSPCPAPSSPIIITAQIDNHTQQDTAVVKALGHRRTASDASQRRQIFAETSESPKGSVHDPDQTPISSQPPLVNSRTGAAVSGPDSLNNKSGCTASGGSSNGGNSSQSVMSTNGHASFTPRAGGETGTSVAQTAPFDHSPLDELHGVELRRKQRPLRQAQSEVPVSMSLMEHQRCSQSLTDAKEHAYARLMTELSKAQRELRLRDEECEKLSMLRTQMEHEIDELSAALFEEANKMVQDAHVRRMNVEKRLEDANHQIDILQGEVVALKHLVVTSTPSTPNKHLHPQICETSPKKEKSSKPFWKSHRRSTSHHEFTKEARDQVEEAQNDLCKVKEMDTSCFDEFQRWKLQPSLTGGSLFLSRVLMEDIRPCLNFRNKQLADRVLQCVQQNSLTIEPIPGDSSFPRKCSLSDMHKLCNYKIKLEEDEDWHSISQLCRNRIAAVCNFYTYIRYIAQGLVKSPDKEMFQEIVRLRLQMATARLGC